MKKLLVFLALALLAPAVFADSSLIERARAHGGDVAQIGRRAVGGAVECKAAPDRWSIAECVEHIAAAEPFIRSMIVKSIEGG